MSGSRQDEVRSLIYATAEHSSDLYREHWGNIRSFEHLAPMSRDILRSVQLSQRRYKEASGLVKLVRDSEGSFLSEWSFEDIYHEQYGVETARTFVYLTDPHETLEKALWCQLHGMPGFAAESDPRVAITAAMAFEADSLITDASAFDRIRPFISAQSMRLRAITVIGDGPSFTGEGEYAVCADEVGFVLALPEVGVIATSTPKMFPRFAPCADCIIEPGPVPLVTKLSMLVTPIIRYRFDGANLAFT